MEKRIQIPNNEQTRVVAAARSVISQALEASGAILRRQFGRVRVRYKGRADLLTEADLRSERAIRGIIGKRFPAHGLLAEEHGARLTDSEYLWVVDPLDGTTNFAHGYPICCISIGLLLKGRPLIAGIYDPFRDECFLAEKGEGATLNGRRLRVSSSTRVATSLLVTGFAPGHAARSRVATELFHRLLVRCHDVRRSGSAALDLAWIAAGRADGFWQCRLNPWDVAAGRLLIEEAGGRVTDFKGRPWTEPLAFGRETLATNGRIHREILGLLGAR